MKMIVEKQTKCRLAGETEVLGMIVEKQMECRLAGETEVLGENLPQRHFYPSQNPT
jgi:hypothetical protein